MPELTVSMPAYNTGKYIKAAIESVLAQEGVDFELIIVDDNSTDNTVDVVHSFTDPRIKLFRNSENMGVGYCHNLVIPHSKSPYIAQVDSDDIALPGAFHELVGAFRNSPHVGLVHCYYFYINEEGNVTRDAFRVTRKGFHTNMKPGMDYKRELVFRGSVASGLRIFRRDVFKAVGTFNETMRSGGDQEMVLRAVDKFDIKLVPEFLYGYRIHGASISSKRRSKSFKYFRSWLRRYILCRRLLKSNKVQFLKHEEYNLNKLMFARLYYILKYYVYRMIRAPRNIFGLVSENILMPLLKNSYEFAVAHFSWRPRKMLDPKWENKLMKEKRLAYYLTTFPQFPDIVIREVAVLKQVSNSVEVFADTFGNKEFLDETACSLIDSTHYLLPIDRKRLSKYKRYFFLKRPLRCLNLFLFVVFHRYHQYKYFGHDKTVFLRALYLAGLLAEHDINHLHAPWATNAAFVALIASRLLGIRYSVQARASDIHRNSNKYGLAEKLNYAELIITNSQYNADQLRCLTHQQSGKEIHTIYNGLDLKQFNPTPNKKHLSNPTSILSVARLIEPKGLVYLLHAFKILKEQGYQFRGEIIGGADKRYMNYYLTLKKLHRRLGLEDRVFFFGAQPFSRVLEAYRNADIFVLPCVKAEDGSNDITPNSIIEAMAMKLPVVSTNITAIPEIVEDGVSGILVPPNDEMAISKAVVKLMNDDNLRRRLGENARKRVEKTFDINNNIFKFVDLFFCE
jgi:glycosyltransferase involved in cell wall biosynthesis